MVLVCKAGYRCERCLPEEKNKVIVGAELSCVGDGGAG